MYHKVILRRRSIQNRNFYNKKNISIIPLMSFLFLFLFCFYNIPGSLQMLCEAILPECLYESRDDVYLQPENDFVYIAQTRIGNVMSAVCLMCK